MKNDEQAPLDFLQIAIAEDDPWRTQRATLHPAPPRSDISEASIAPHEIIDLTIHTHTPKKFVKSEYRDVISRENFIQSLKTLEKEKEK